MQTKTVTAGENACTVTLTGEEIMIKFSSGAPFFWVKNTGNSEFYAAARPGANPGSDGVYPICAGEIQLLPAGCDSKIIYLSGTGSALVISSPIAACPFKKSVKGGDENSAGITPMPNMYGVIGYFLPNTIDIANNVWHNSLTNGIDISLYGGSSDGSSLHLASGEYGEYATTAELSTVYLVLKLGDDVTLPLEHLATVFMKQLASTSYNTQYGFNLLCNLDGYAFFSASTKDIGQDTYTLDRYVAVCFTKENGHAYYYINDLYCGTNTAKDGGFGKKYGINDNIAYANTTTRWDYVYDIDLKMCVFGTEFHSSETVSDNLRWIMNRFGITN